MKKNMKLVRAGRTLTIFHGFLLFSMIIVSVIGCARYSVRDAETLPPEEAPIFSAKVYFIDQKFWTVGDQFTISDEQGNPVFYVKERVFTVGDRLSFMDMQGKMIFNIKEKLLSIGKQFRIYNRDQLVARVLKRIKLFNDKFIIDLPEDDGYVVKGDFINYRYAIFRNGRKVAQILKKMGTVTDNYMVRIGPREDDLIILASAIIIDMASHKEE